MPKARPLVHSAWFDFALTRLGGAERMDDMLGKELYRLSLYADLVPVSAADTAMRIYRTAPFLRDDGQIVRLWIYFVLRNDDAVELHHIEAVDEDMGSLAAP